MDRHGVEMFKVRLLKSMSKIDQWNHLTQATLGVHTIKGEANTAAIGVDS